MVFDDEPSPSMLPPENLWPWPSHPRPSKLNHMVVRVWGV